MARGDPQTSWRREVSPALIEAGHAAQSEIDFGFADLLLELERLPGRRG
ncbi:MAG: hypothetical protein ABI770_00780 [Sphingomicrobium sp.]